MPNYKYQLEKYHGAKSRLRCPGCGEREFSRYVDEFGSPLSDDVGKCNRENKCGYHKKPRQFFAENPRQFTRKYLALNKPPKIEVKPDVITDDALVTDSWQDYENNNFVQSLLSSFSWEVVQALIRTFLFGTDGAGKVIFWQFDQDFQTRTGKIMLYDKQSGKRQPLKTWIDHTTGKTEQQKIDLIHSRLKKQGKLPENFNLRQCFFGEHLLTTNAEIQTVAIVESEKTAVICQAFWQNIIFLACGGLNNLSDERMKVLQGKRIILFPDAGCFDLWNEKAKQFIKEGYNIKVSCLIESKATPEEKAEGFDLADYLIRERKNERQFEKIERQAIQESG